MYAILKMRQIFGPQHYASSFLCSWFRRRASRASNYSHVWEGADLRIVSLGSGGAILNLDWFLNYRDIKLVGEVSEIERNHDMFKNFVY